MYFSIAEQSVQLPDGSVLTFRVNPNNTALVELTIVGSDQHGNAGTHILSFNRNGTSAGQEFLATPNPVNPAIDPVSGRRLDGPLSGFRSVNDDAVRGDARDGQGNRSPGQGFRNDGLGVQSSTGAGNLGRDAQGNPNDPNRSATGGAKVDPVHGRINTVGMDNVPTYPAEGKPPLDPQRVG